MDADEVIATLAKDTSHESLLSALSWLDSNASHYSVEYIVDRIMQISVNPDIVELLLQFVENHPNVAISVLPIVVNYSKGAERPMRSAKAWIHAHPYDVGAEWLLRECLKQTKGGEFGDAALNWLGTQPDTAQTADLLAALIVATPGQQVIAETRVWLARNWYASDSLGSVLLALLYSDSDEAYQLGSSYLKRIATTENEWISRSDCVAKIVYRILSSSSRAELNNLVREFLITTSESRDWSIILAHVICYGSQSPSQRLIEFCKEWLRLGQFGLRPDFVICQLLDMGRDEEVIQIAHEVLRSGLQIKIAEESLREKLQTFQ